MKWFLAAALALSLASPAFATDLTNIGSITDNGGPITFNGELQDTSTIVGSGPAFFTPAWYGNSAHGRVDKFNRVQVGVEALGSADIVAGAINRSTPTWVDSYAQVMALAQIGATSAVGTTAIAGAARTSDFRPWGGNSGGSGVVSAVGVNDDAISPHPIMCVFCSYQFQEANVPNGITLSQFDMNTSSPTVVPSSQNVDGGTTWGLGITAGAKRPGNNSSAGFYIGNGAYGQRFERGGVVMANALDTMQGHGGGGVAFEFGGGQSIIWTGPGKTILAEMWGDAGGLHFTGGLTTTVAIGGCTLVYKSGLLTAKAGC